MSVYAIMQARMGSSRLPGKVLMPIGRKPALRHVIDRVRKCCEVDNVLIATSALTQDDAIALYCSRNDIPYFRGSEADVLDRYYQAALYLGADNGDYIMRITGDCPFIDPAVCSEVIALARMPGTDYASNTIEETYPDGLDCEVFTFETLRRMCTDAKFVFEREHVTQHAKRNPDKFRLRNLRCMQNLSDERWTLDEPEDYEFLCRVYGDIGKEFFSMEDVIKSLKKNPDIREINRNIVRNEGLIKSIKREGIEK